MFLFIWNYPELSELIRTYPTICGIIKVLRKDLNMHLTNVSSYPLLSQLIRTYPILCRINRVLRKDLNMHLANVSIHPKLSALIRQLFHYVGSQKFVEKPKT